MGPINFQLAKTLTSMGQLPTHVRSELEPPLPKDFLHHHQSWCHLLSGKQLSASIRTAALRQTSSVSSLVMVRDGHVSFRSCCTDVRGNLHHGPPLKNAPRCMIKEDKWLQRAVLSQLNSKRRLSEIILSKTASICAAPRSPPSPLSLLLSPALFFLSSRCSRRLLTYSELLELKPNAFAVRKCPAQGFSATALTRALRHDETAQVTH